MSDLYSSVEMHEALAAAWERIGPGVADATSMGARGPAELILAKFDAEGKGATWPSRTSRGSW